jgi:cytochrome oxidase Cu insertion factor (SCO1/SenC/PrrC family)
MTKRLLRIAILAIPTLIVAAIVAYISLPDRAGPGAGSGGAGQSGNDGLRVASSDEIGGPFELVDHHGDAFSSSDISGDYKLMFFGFTYCPDFCPQELSTMAQVIDLLEDESDTLHPLFVTIDPERDTPEAMADYVDLFHPRIIGLTGSSEQVADVASTFRVFYQRSESEQFEDYMMDHSTFTYLMGPDDENLAIFAHGATAEEMAAAIRTLMNETRG